MDKLKIFQNTHIRSHWDADSELWFFSVVDIIQILTDSDRPRKYWNDLKQKLNQEGSEVSEKIGQLKMNLTPFIGHRNSKDFLFYAQSQKYFIIAQFSP